MYLKCVKNGYGFKEGEIYEVAEVQTNYWKVISDKGYMYVGRESKLFEVVKEIDSVKRDIDVKVDNVNHPNHYKTPGGIEVIEYIDSLLGDNTKAYYIGNIIKYISRYDKKNGLEDLKKAKFYLEKMIEKMEEKENEKIKDGKEKRKE